MGHAHYHHHDTHDEHAHAEDSHEAGELSARHFRVLRRVFFLTAAYLLLEIIGGLISGSLALLADGFHMFADSTAIGIALFAQWLMHRPAPMHRTFGYERMEIMAAFFNGLLLITIGCFILWESYERMQDPVSIKADLMMGIALGGLIINIICASLLHKDHQHNLNIKGAYLHVLGDLLGSIGAILAGLFILLFQWVWFDPLISVLIALMVIGSAIGLLREAISILLEGCPPCLDIDDIRAELLAQEGIQAVHHLHVWRINMRKTVLTAHLEVTQEAFADETLKTAQVMLKERFNLSHATLQMELARI